MTMKKRLMILLLTTLTVGMDAHAAPALKAKLAPGATEAQAQDVAAQAQAATGNAATVVRDPSTGKVLSVIVNLPQAGPGNDTAASKLAANNGVATVNIVIPATDAASLTAALQQAATSQFTTVDLQADIDMMTPAPRTGPAVTTLTGHINGNGHTISNFSSDSPFVGSMLSGSSIENLKLDSLNVSATDASLASLSGGFGGLVASVSWNTTGTAISNVSLTNATVSCLTSQCGYTHVGGLVGVAMGWSPLTISKSSFSGAVNGSAGAANAGSGMGVGGIVGLNYYSAIVTDSYAKGSISGNLVGGLGGYMIGGSFTNSYFSGSISAVGNLTQAGGLVGSDGSWSTNCFANLTSVPGTGKHGLIAGYAQGAYSNIEVTGPASVLDPTLGMTWNGSARSFSSTEGRIASSMTQVHTDVINPNFSSTIWNIDPAGLAEPTLK